MPIASNKKQYINTKKHAQKVKNIFYHLLLLLLEILIILQMIYIIIKIIRNLIKFENFNI